MRGVFVTPQGRAGVRAQGFPSPWPKAVRQHASGAAEHSPNCCGAWGGRRAQNQAAGSAAETLRPEAGSGSRGTTGAGEDAGLTCSPADETGLGTLPSQAAKMCGQKTGEV